jgi:hypothetical protein
LGCVPRTQVLHRVMLTMQASELVPVLKRHDIGSAPNWLICQYTVWRGRMMAEIESLLAVEVSVTLNVVPRMF